MVILKSMKNKMYKHIKIFTSWFFASIILFPVLVYAQADFSAPLENPLNSIDSFSGFVEAILGIVVRIGVPIATIAIIYSGFLFVTAQGNPENLATAKKAFIWSIVGTAILLGAWVFAQAIGTTITEL